MLLTTHKNNFKKNPKTSEFFFDFESIYNIYQIKNQ